MDNMLEKHFKELGFSSNEIKTYLYLAESGGASAHNIAKRIKVPRTTIYSVVTSLTDKGLISQEQKKGTTYFIPNKPESILRLIERKQEEIKKKELVAKELIELVTPYFNTKHYSIPKMQFFEGRESVENMLYDNLETWRASMASYDSIWWGYQDVGFVKEYRRWLEYTWTLKTDMELYQILSNQDPIERELENKVPGRTMKQMPREFNFSSTIWVMGDYIVLLMTKAEPHYAFQLRDTLFAANLRLVYQLLWGFLK